MVVLHILDGGLATELEKRGANLNHELWSAKLLCENPQLIKQVHFDFYKAGATVCTTASYQASVQGFEKLGYAKQEAEALIRKSVQLCKQARDDFFDAHTNRKRGLVAASIGTYGSILHDGSEYTGNFAKEMQNDTSILVQYHMSKAQLLLQESPDLLLFETIPCLLEAQAIVQVAEKLQTKAWISFCCRNETQVSSGETLLSCVQAVANSPYIEAIGVNCTAPKFILPLMDALLTSSKHILIYPNSGETYQVSQNAWHGDGNVEQFVQMVQTFVTKGATIVGGCCRVYPEHIAAIAEVLEKK